MKAVRRPVGAGRFYPADPHELAALVDRLLDAAPPPALPAGRLCALVVPHAGYLYSGAVAAAGFAAIRAGARDLGVVLLGPSHFAPLEGAAVSEAYAWKTPLGSVPVDRELCAAALAAGAVANERPHRNDHALEVQLPFLQRCAGSGLRIVPIAVGATAGAAELVAALAPDALIVVSSDLSQFQPPVGPRGYVTVAVPCDVALGDLALPGLPGQVTVSSTFTSVVDSYRAR